MSVRLIPNILTLSRIVFVPFFITFFYSDLFYYKFLSLIIFFICSLTDFLDGYLARRYNLVTSIGRFIDPLADKILVLSALFVICNIYPHYLPLWMVLVILSRDILVTFLRFFLRFKGKTLQTSILAKRKTLFQIFVIHIILLTHVFDFLNDLFLSESICYGLMFSCVSFTVLSGMHYFYVNLHDE